jgi:hypothetical protein
MSVARSSYLKTAYLAAAGAISAAVIALLVQFAMTGAVGDWFAVFAWLSSALAFFVLLSCLIVLHRDNRAAAGQPDLFLTLNRSRSEPVLANLAESSRPRGFRWPRFLSANSLRVGDWVEVRSWEEIRQTLDENGALEGVPFMTEMLPFCGKRARILRSVDKVYDYGGSKTLRRIDNTVLLTNVRCDGAAHDGCQARCSIFWKTAWLRRANEPQAVKQASGSQAPAPSKVSDRYVCQYTQVVASSRPLSRRDLRQDIKPLFAGNVTVSTFLMALMTRLFNRVQGLRGGIPFPLVTNSGQPKTPTEQKGLAVGERVRVLSAKEIGDTLDLTFRNRGMWFDREMLKFCRQPYQVLLRVDRIIDDATGRMVPMKTPCILLDDVVASGEFLRFLAQQEYIFWRENWLARESPTGGS